MSKSILVIDTPGNCTVCEYYNKENDECKKEEFAVCYEHRTGDRCPLKPVPRKQYANPTNGYIAGYNDCIDEILKGANWNEQRTSL